MKLLSEALRGRTPTPSTQMVRSVNVSGDKALSSISCCYHLASVHLPSCYHGSSKRNQLDNSSFISWEKKKPVRHLSGVGRYDAFASPPVDTHQQPC